MKKAIMILCALGFSSLLSCGIAQAAELKECESEQDAMLGCVAKKLYENGNLYIAMPYKNGKVNGTAKVYYENGNLKVTTPFTSGKQNGIEKGYYENGNMQYELPYKSGEKQGIYKQYYENGNLGAAIPYKNGKVNGMQKWYYEEGDIWAEIPYTDNKLHGTIKFYGKKLLWQLSAQNGKILSGKCANGKAFTRAHLEKLSKDLEESEIGGEYWYQICE